MFLIIVDRDLEKVMNKGWKKKKRKKVGENIFLPSQTDGKFEIKGIIFIQLRKKAT